MDYLLRVEDLAKRYDGFALEGVSLAVERGMVVGLVGSNGAGKTTTLKAVLGLIAADGGAIELMGAPIEGPGSRAVDAVKARVGVVLDTCAFPDSCRVADVGAIGRAAYRTWDDALFAELRERFGLAPRKTVRELSRGMGMKLSLAFALAHRPQLLVLDEATAGLDPLARDEVLDLLRAFMADGEHGILMSTHITSDLEKIADEVACIDGGRLVFDVPRDVICDEVGIVRCREADLDAVLACGALAPGQARVMRHGYSIDVLVPDRAALVRALDGVAVDRATIEEYMTLMLRGEAR
ncbi:MAG: ABC transporter ATP-binding protein [Eggerthellaceae bacterium]|nr:ABC transporter ATP-binding protein [Eggerthellaceae bacterium]